MRFFYKIIFFSLFLSLSLPSSFLICETGYMNYINKIELKEKTSFDDGLTMVLILMKKSVPRSFFGRLKLIKRNGCLDRGFDKKQGERLTRGDISLMVARCLKLKGSFLYWLFKNGRYGMRLLVYHNLMPSLKSEWDSLNGEELIEIIRMASEYQQNKKIRK